MSPSDITNQELLAALTEQLGVITDNMVVKDDLIDFATKEDLNNFATKDDLKNFATKDDLKALATKDDIKLIWNELATTNQQLDGLESEVKGTRSDIGEIYDRLVVLEPPNN